MGSHRTVLSDFDTTEVEASRVGSAGLPAIRHYHPGVCNMCLISPPDPIEKPLSPPLLRCSQCQLVVYCSKDCQKKDWGIHRALCRANKVVSGKNVFSKAKEAVAEGQNWNDFRNNLALVASINLKRKLQQHEFEMFWFPRVCEVCKEANNETLACCPRCFSVFYCSSLHKDQDKMRHDKNCSNYLLLLECDRIESENGIQDLPIPVQVDADYKNLPEKLITLVKPQLERDSVSPLDPLYVTMITERLSYPLSLLYALRNIGIGSENTALHKIKELKVHVVGAQSYTELMGIIRWEYMAHRLPLLKGLHLVFIGPELFSLTEFDEEVVPDKHIIDESCDTMCDDCRSRQRRIIYEMACMTYREYVESDKYSRPDIVVSYNCGIHEHSGQATDEWKASLPLLVQNPYAPFVFTSYSEEEAQLDLAALRNNVSVKVLFEPHLNPFHSLRPYRESSGSPPIYFWNNFITCVRSADDV